VDFCGFHNDGGRMDGWQWERVDVYVCGCVRVSSMFFVCVCVCVAHTLSESS